MRRLFICLFFFFNDTATTEIYTLSLHDALPISLGFGENPPVVVGEQHPWRAVALDCACRRRVGGRDRAATAPERAFGRDRKSTRLNSSHANISYAVFCLKKKKIYPNDPTLLQDT